MPRITLNLARQPGENLRRVRIVWGGAVALLGALLLALGGAALAGWLGSRPIARQAAALRAAMAPLADARQPNPDSDPRIRAGLAQAAYLNQLIDRKAVSWTLLFERLEQIQPRGVELVSLRPLLRNGANAIDIRFASQTLPPAIAFVQRLENSPDFADARIERESEAAAAAPGPAAPSGAGAPARFQFELTALYQTAWKRYQPAAPPLPPTPARPPGHQRQPVPQPRQPEPAPPKAAVPSPPRRRTP